MSQDTTTQVQVEEDGHKVFVGNLSFKTTEAELAEHFSKPNKVVRADIITRQNRDSTRSLGFGFVVYETLAHAELAAQTYNKTDLGGRKINVEVAKPKSERPPREPRQRAPRPAKEESKDEAAPEADADTDAADVKPRSGRNRKPNRKNKPRKEGEEGKAEESTSAATDAPAASSDGWGAAAPAQESGGWDSPAPAVEEGWGGSNAPANTNGWGSGSGDAKDDKPKRGPKKEGDFPRREGGGKRGGKRGGFSKREGNQDAAQESSTNQDDSANQDGQDDANREGSQRRGGGSGRGRGGPRRFAPRKPKTGPLSKTTVFVANIPFSMTDEGLQALFTNYKVTAAHVAFTPGPNKRPRGFGFVELADEQEQQKVLDELKELKADGRDLSIKPALADDQLTPEKEGETSA
ncbi:hypothetical protein B0O80DRAFT_439271 [Mortierella sp. GBAus27b]|nr:hypothetical protein BGX31_006655 [Mortierella sp. GBA43]KAI8360415.1 hypothetical protein B0O80DRAFT_439271 [Mortierella sp. GBAus27b]